MTRHLTTPMQTPLTNPELEAALLGILLIDPDAYLRVADDLRDSYFSSAAHVAIFQAISTAALGGTINYVAVANLLEATGKLEICGGAVYLTQLLDGVTSVSYLEQHASKVQELAQRRELIGVAGQIARDAQDMGKSVVDVQASAESLLLDAATHTESATVVSASTLAGDLLARVGAFMSGEARWNSVPTGIKPLDDCLAGGLEPGVYIIAGRASMGKTSLALQIATHIASHGKRVAFFSIEMSNREVGLRMMSTLARVPLRIFKAGLTTPEQNLAITNALGEISEWPMHIIDRSDLCAADVLLTAQRIALEHKDLAVVFVDGLWLMTADQKFSNREQELSSISKGVKQAQRHLDVPIVITHQLSRGPEHRTDKRPMLSDLRDCLPGSARITDAISGRQLTVGEIYRDYCIVGLESGYGRDMGYLHVFGIDGGMGLVMRPITDIWPAGKQPIYRVTTRAGFSIDCTMGHRFFTGSGFQEARQLCVGDMVALPRGYAPETPAPSDWREGLLLGWVIGDGWCGKHSIQLTTATKAEARYAAQLGRRLGFTANVRKDNRSAWRADFSGVTSWLDARDLRHIGAEKGIPGWVFQQDNEYIAAVLRGLFHADGTYKGGNKRGRVVQYVSISETLARQVQSLLLRLGIFSSLGENSMRSSGFRPSTSTIYSVSIYSIARIAAFAARVGFLGQKQRRIVLPERRAQNGIYDRLPLSVNMAISNSLGVRHGKRSIARYGWRDQGKHMDRARASHWADICGSQFVRDMAHSDLFWDAIVSIEHVGEEEVYDLEVEGTHNFFANDILTHNSGAVEQDSDIVLMLYREKYYDPDGSDVAEIWIRKNRLGGESNEVVKMFWLQNLGRFERIAYDSEQ